MSDETQSLEETTEPVENDEATALERARRAHYDRIVEMEREVGKAEAEYTAKKESASAAKKRFEAADEELRQFIRRGPDLQQRLPGMDEAEQAEPEAWRAVPVGDLGLRPSIIIRLAEAGITTIGQIADQTAEYGETWHNTIDGIGLAAAESISRALEDFWAEHPEYAEAEPEPEEEEDHGESDDV